jgi:serine/threonine protein kinase
MVFELITGDYLFDPKKGRTFKKNDDHLALITELIGEMNPVESQQMKETCDAWEDFYEPCNKSKTRFKLRRIKSLKEWRLRRVLVEKYMMKETEAYYLEKFLYRMLKWCPKDRAQARDLLNDPWLKLNSDDSETHMSKCYFREWRRTQGDDEETSSNEEESSGQSGSEEESSAEESCEDD